MISTSNFRIRSSSRVKVKLTQLTRFKRTSPLNLIDRIRSMLRPINFYKRTSGKSYRLVKKSKIG